MGLALRTVCGDDPAWRLARDGFRARLDSGTALATLISIGVVSLALAQPALAQQALPAGGSVTSGQATISSSGTRLLVEQSSATGIISWDSFSIGGGASVHFDNGAGATLNRVTGANPSDIHGSLSATGSLYLVNPAGVTVGPGGRVMTGGSFVASTHGVSDAEFNARGSMTFSGSSRAAVVNHGTIRSAGGDVALIARRVENTGDIDARQGTAGLVAGYEVLMRSLERARRPVCGQGRGRRHRSRQFRHHPRCPDRDARPWRPCAGVGRQYAGRCAGDRRAEVGRPYLPDR